MGSRPCALSVNQANCLGTQYSSIVVKVVGEAMAITGLEKPPLVRIEPQDVRKNTPLAGTLSQDHPLSSLDSMPSPVGSSG